MRLVQKVIKKQSDVHTSLCSRSRFRIRIDMYDKRFIRSGQNHLARHSERVKKTRQTKEEVRRQLQGMDRPGVRQVSEGSGEQGKWKKLVVKSSVAPQRPSRLRDRCGEDDGYV